MGKDIPCDNAQIGILPYLYFLTEQRLQRDYQSSSRMYNAYAAWM